MTDLDRLRFDLTSTMHRAGRDWRRLVRDLVVAHGISEAAALPLITVGRLGDGARQVTVAEEVGIEGPSLVRILDQLCTNGLVERRDDPADRRAKTLWLTEAGRRVTRRMEQDLVMLRAQVLAGVSEDDLVATLRVFQAIQAAAQPGALEPASAEAEPAA